MFQTTSQTGHHGPEADDLSLSRYPMMIETTKQTVKNDQKV